MVHMNIFYRMDLQLRDPKNELLTKTRTLPFEKVEEGVEDDLPDVGALDEGVGCAGF